MGQDSSAQQQKARDKPRARDIGIVVGTLPTGQHNAITDVAGVKVGHVTLIEGESVRTGATAILPHGGNMFQEKVPAAIYLGNAFGKLIGYTQVKELGNIETPILLTNTLNVGLVADGLVDYMINLPGNQSVRSINPVVGETNDGGLNDIRGRHVKQEHVKKVIESAQSGPVTEGVVGAGTGTSCYGYKGGIGTSSRVAGNYTVGVLVQTNFGGTLIINGAPVYKELGRSQEVAGDHDQGSCMIVIATDAPVLSRNLERLAKRAMLGLARTGSYSGNGSGDYVIAFSTAEDLRIGSGARSTTSAGELENGRMSNLFKAVVEATEEAVYNSMFKATTVTGRNGRTVQAIPIDKVVEICRKYNVIQDGK
ncbi:MAG: P1 family peptidase [Planctomycetes bacterium]|nr:P1 family peptidase [Planctomycetota bacterium]